MRERIEEIAVVIGDDAPSLAVPQPKTLRPKFFTVTWTHTELLPAHLLAGFNVILYTGVDPNDTDAYLCQPIRVGPSERTVVKALRLKDSVTVQAAVQSVYTNGNVSGWRTLAAGVVGDPDTFKLATGTLSNVDVGSVTPRLMSGEGQLPFEQTFDNWDPTDWDVNSGSISNCAIVAGAGEFGGNVLRCTGNTWLIWKHNIPFDPTKTYKVTTRFRVVTEPTVGGRTVYGGLAGVAADGVTKVNASGADSYSSNHYGPAGASPPGGAWATYTFYWKGWGAPNGSAGVSDPNLAPGVMHSSVRYFRPLVIVNWAPTSDGVSDIDSISVEEVGYAVGTHLMQAGSVSPSRLVQGANALGFHPPNGGFEAWLDPAAMPDSWQSESTAAWTREASVVHSGQYSLKSPSATTPHVALSELFPVQPLHKYKVWMMRRTSSSASLGGNAKFGLRFYTAAGAYISDVAPQISPTNNAWIAQYSYITAPSNAAYARVRIVKDTSLGTAQDLFVDGVYVRTAEVSVGLGFALQTVTSSAWKQLTHTGINSGDHDTWQAWNNAAANAFKVPSGMEGPYLISGSVVWGNGTALGYMLLTVFRNGAEFRHLDYISNAPANGPMMGGSTVVWLSAGDVVDIRAFQTSGANRDITAGVGSQFGITRLASDG